MVKEHPDVDVIVIGGGLAGTDAAWLAARHGLRVALYEMRPRVMTPAHKTDRLAELVCSNSLKSNLLTTAVGLLVCLRGVAVRKREGGWPRLRLSELAAERGRVPRLPGGAAEGGEGVPERIRADQAV